MNETDNKNTEGRTQGTEKKLEVGSQKLEEKGSEALQSSPKSQLLTPNSSAEPRSADPFFSGRKHFPALDGLRGIAVLLVLVCHYGFWLAPPNRTVAVVKLASFQGWIGVNLFFVLSGFLITGILLDSKGQLNYYRNFYARRFLRIFPLYYGVLFAVLFIITALRAALPGFYSRDHNAHAILSAMPWLWSYTTNIGIAFFFPQPQLAHTFLVAGGGGAVLPPLAGRSILAFTAAACPILSSVGRVRPGVPPRTDAGSYPKRS